VNTGVYIRVSSPKDSQRAELEAWLKRHRHTAVQWFEDHESGITIQREAFQQLQTAIFAGKISTAVVWKLDRLARNLKEGVNVLADWCKRGVRVIAVTQQIDLSGPSWTSDRHPVVWYCRDRIAAREKEDSGPKDLHGIWLPMDFVRGLQADRTSSR
jgi:hypothetical protein